MLGKELLQELKMSGNKYSEKDIIFIAHDRSGQLIWLEKGDEEAGLVHIRKHHAADFKRAHGVNEDELADLLYLVVTKGAIVSSLPSGNGRGYDRVYDYEENYFTFTGIGSNGFIVTAFPVNKKGCLA